jgi:hypothetical protein
MTLVIKRVDPEKLRMFKAEAARRGLRLHQALEEAITLWLKYKPFVLETEIDVNNRVYEEMREELLRKYRGKFILIASGRLIGVFDGLEEAAGSLEKLRPNIKHAILTRIGVDEEYHGEYEWWGGSIEP